MPKRRKYKRQAKKRQSYQPRLLLMGEDIVKAIKDSADRMAETQGLRVPMAKGKARIFAQIAKREVQRKRKTENVILYDRG
ncbi:MAG: hypothetical protein J7L14_03250 [Candidatus Diapherotrites archaeon]|nr:hypothetical protein [Candidatus Diapherotrites archaeon]